MAAEMVTLKEKQYLQGLAKKQVSYANLPIMKEREDLWFQHNTGQGKKPLVVIEEMSFYSEILPSLQCETPLAREIEHSLVKHIVNHEITDDDKVIPDFYELPLMVHYKEFAVGIETEKPKETSLGFQYKHLLHSLEEDLDKLQKSTYSFDRARNDQKLEQVQDVLGDSIPVVQRNSSLDWSCLPTYKAVKLLGLEQFLLDMMLEPERTEKFLTLITDDIIEYVEFQEENGLLNLNNGNHYAGSGSYGFSHELAQTGDKVLAKDLWINLNSQESSDISPTMYGEQVFPHYKRLAEQFGLVYYGCCEPVHTVWEKYLSTIPNLRKVSISPWCNEELMGEALKGTKTIYSRKPSPNFYNASYELDAAAYRAHIQKSFDAAKDCTLEFIIRDVYLLGGNPNKVSQAVKIIRNVIG